MKPTYFPRAVTRITAIFLIALGVTTPTDASITWLMSDDGKDLTLTTTGSINVGNHTGILRDSILESGYASSSSTYYHKPQYYVSQNNQYGGFFDPSAHYPTLGEPDIMSGDSFGNTRMFLYWDVKLGSQPGIIEPKTTMIWLNTTIESAFGYYQWIERESGLALWHGDTYQQLIGINAVSKNIPEPSSAFLFCVGGLALLCRRHRSITASAQIYSSDSMSSGLHARDGFIIEGRSLEQQAQQVAAPDR